jgi:hypothetical protein
LQGASVIYKALFALLQFGYSFPGDEVTDLSRDDVFEYIMVPEAAMLLIMQDTKCSSPSDAFQTMKRSYRFGHSQYPPLQDDERIRKVVSGALQQFVQDRGEEDSDEPRWAPSALDQVSTLCLL